MCVRGVCVYACVCVYVCVHTPCIRPNPVEYAILIKVLVMFEDQWGVLKLFGNLDEVEGHTLIVIPAFGHLWGGRGRRLNFLKCNQKACTFNTHICTYTPPSPPEPHPHTLVSRGASPAP